MLASASGPDRQVGPPPARVLAAPVTWTAATFADTGWLMPGSAGAAGPTQILTASSGRIRLFDKSGAPQSLNVTTMAFFASVANGNDVIYPRVTIGNIRAVWRLA